MDTKLFKLAEELDKNEKFAEADKVMEKIAGLKESLTRFLFAATREILSRGEFVLLDEDENISKPCRNRLLAMFMRGLSPKEAVDSITKKSEEESPRSFAESDKAMQKTAMSPQDLDKFLFQAMRKVPRKGVFPRLFFRDPEAQRKEFTPRQKRTLVEMFEKGLSPEEAVDLIIQNLRAHGAGEEEQGPRGRHSSFLNSVVDNENRNSIDKPTWVGDPWE